MRVLTDIAIALSAICLFSAASVQAEVLRDDNAGNVVGKKTPIYMWQDDTKKPRGLVVAIHGLSMHGGVYDALARDFASQGFIVFAPDLRGYGRWQKTGHRGSAKIDYDKSYKDCKEIVKSARAHYPNLPLFCLGESLGAGLAMHVAVDCPDQVDGLILSSPALQRRAFVGPVMSEIPGFLTRPMRKIDLKPYIKKYSSEDPQIVEATLNDPLVTKKLTAWELATSFHYIRPNLDYARRIPANMPVLVIQGTDDRILRTSAVNKLLARTKCTDQTVCWFNDRGHVLLETSFLKKDTLHAVDNWLLDHVGAQTTQVSITQSDATKRFVSSSLTNPTETADYAQARQ